MKVFVAVSILAIGFGGVLVYNEMQQRQVLSQQVDDYDRKVSQLLTQIENNSLQNIETDKQLLSLQSELNSRGRQIAALSRQLELALQQADPDYEQVESRIRQQLSREVQVSNRGTYADPRISVLKQLSGFDPMETSQIISLNAQYGDFLKSLNISEERMGSVINALSNMDADQTQAQRALAEEMRADPTALNSNDFQERMQAISEPQAQIEALSYELTESELNAFSEFQEQRRQSYNPFFIHSTSSGGTFSTSTGTTSSTSTGTTSPINFFSTELIERDSGQPRAVRILPAQPVN